MFNNWLRVYCCYAHVNGCIYRVLFPNGDFVMTILELDNLFAFLLKRKRYRRLAAVALWIASYQYCYITLLLWQRMAVFQVLTRFFDHFRHHPRAFQQVVLHHFKDLAVVT